jgi:hypothetical protein
MRWLVLLAHLAACTWLGFMTLDGRPGWPLLAAGLTAFVAGVLHATGRAIVLAPPALLVGAAAFALQGQSNASTDWAVRIALLAIAAGCVALAGRALPR